MPVKQWRRWGNLSRKSSERIEDIFGPALRATISGFSRVYG